MPKYIFWPWLSIVVDTQQMIEGGISDIDACNELKMEKIVDDALMKAELARYRPKPVL